MNKKQIFIVYILCILQIGCNKMQYQPLPRFIENIMPITLQFGMDYIDVINNLENSGFTEISDENVILSDNEYRLWREPSYDPSKHSYRDIRIYLQNIELNFIGLQGYLGMIVIYDKFNLCSILNEDLIRKDKLVKEINFSFYELNEGGYQYINDKNLLVCQDKFYKIILRSQKIDNIVDPWPFKWF